jgi:transcriptional regulator with XRE-family HTH domain
MLPRTWEPSPIAFLSFTEINANAGGGVAEYLSNPVIESEGQEIPPRDTSPRQPELEIAVTAIKELLGLTDEQVEAATGVSRSTLWRLRTGRTGGTRSVTEAPIWRLHSLARAIADVIGIDGLRSWLHAGDPSPAALLARGELALVEQAADRVLFIDHVVPRRGAAVADDDYDPIVPMRSDAVGPSAKPRRVRRPGGRSH